MALVMVMVLGILPLVGLTFARGASAAQSSPRAGQSPVHAASFSIAGWDSLLGGGTVMDGVACPSIFGCYVAGWDFGTTNTGVVWANNGQAGDNSGSDWVKQLSVPGGYFDDLSCAPGSSDCVAVGGTGTGSPANGIAYYTPDGLVWHEATLPAGVKELGWVKCLPNGPDNPNVPSGYCWANAINGTGWRSTDGGQTWTAMTLVATAPGGTHVFYNGMAFVSTTTGWMTGYTDCSAVTGACRGVVAKTTDGGLSWTLEDTPADMPDMIDISCPSTTECVAVGATTTRAAAYVTVDAGAHWQQSTLPFGMSLANGVSCPDSAHCYVVGQSGSSTDPTGSVVFASTDGGRSWTVEPVAGGPSDLADIACPTTLQCYAAGASRAGAAISATTNGGVPAQGYWFVAADGGIFSFHAPFQGSAGGGSLTAPIVGMGLDRLSGGYWLVGADGAVYSYDALSYGSAAGQHLNRPIVGMAATLDGFGYYLLASDGGIFTYGDAVFQGSAGGIRLNKPIVGMALDRLTGGYWLVASDGGVFSFDAPFQGSMGGMHLNKPIVAMAVDPATGGYWLVASDGGVFSFDAPFYGSTGGIKLNKPIVGIQPTSDGHGYWLVASDGGIFSYGDAHFYGSTGGTRLNQPIVAMASSS
jgi:hypothetical protein